MRLFLDHDVYAVTASTLRSAGHDVVLASEVDCAAATDTEILRRAHQDESILVTRDRHFGGLVFIGGLSAGVIYLRLTPASLPAVHGELLQVLTLYSNEALLRAFVVVEAGRHRYRRLPPAQEVDS